MILLCSLVCSGAHAASWRTIASLLRPMVVLTLWNPMTLHAAHRKFEVSHRLLANSDIVVLTGTSLWNQGLPVRTQKLSEVDDPSIALHFGFARKSTMTNKSAGITICMKNRYYKMVSNIFHPLAMASVEMYKLQSRKMVFCRLY